MKKIKKISENQDRFIDKNNDPDETLDEVIDDKNDGQEIIELIDNLPIDQEEKEKILMMVSRETYSGPIPHPKYMRGYYDIDPSIVKDIFEMSFKEQEYIHEQRKSSDKRSDERLRLAGRDNLLGAILGFILLMTLIGMTVLLIYLDKDVAAFMFGGTTLAGLIKLFVFPTKFISEKDKKESDKK